MSTQTGVFICPSCESVVRSDRPLEDGIRCEECDHEFGQSTEFKGTHATAVTAIPRGAVRESSGSVVRDLTRSKTTPRVRDSIVARIPAVEVQTVDEVVAEAARDNDDDVEILPDGARRVKRRKKRPKKERHKGLVLFLAGWIGVVVIIFALFKMARNENQAEEESLTEEALSDQTMKAEVLKRFYPQVAKSFIQFVNHPTNEGREQYISHSAELALSFSRHYQRHTFPTPESRMRVSATNVIKLSERDFGIETIWQDAEGRKLGAVHLWDGEAWKLDWENFAPYSSLSWSRFRSEIGPREGNFRLLARKRETTDESEKFYLSFYRSPEFYEDGDEYRATESPEVELATDSRLGREFLKLWADHKAGEAVYESILAKELDPPNCLRLNVVLAWEKNERDESMMVLKDIVSASWFGRVIQEYQEAELQKKAEGDDLATSE